MPGTKKIQKSIFMDHPNVHIKLQGKRELNACATHCLVNLESLKFFF